MITDTPALPEMLRAATSGYDSCKEILFLLVVISAQRKYSDFSRY